MKYGLLYFKDTGNIGDDIQSYAQSRFLPKIDYMVDRENLELFVPSKEEYVKVIMNAWYIHDQFNFNISPYIYPFFTSVFLKRFEVDRGLDIGVDYINKNLINTFKKYSPVGTRDLHTKKLLESFNIDSYLSGCLTLTLDRFDNVEQGDYIVTVGLRDEEIEYVKKHTKYEVKTFIQDVPRGSFSNESWEDRKNRVEDVLKLYQGARMVVTNKLHCSLPCLALQVPVLLLFDDSCEENIDRIGTYLPYLNHINRKDLFNTDYDFDKPKRNPKKYLKLRETLIDSCNEFVNKKIPKGKFYKIDEYKTIVTNSRNMREIPIKKLEEMQEKYNIDVGKRKSEIAFLNGELTYVRDEYNKLWDKYKKYERFDSRLMKIRKIFLKDKKKGD